MENSSQNPPQSDQATPSTSTQLPPTPQSIPTDVPSATPVPNPAAQQSSELPHIDTPASPILKSEQINYPSHSSKNKSLIIGAIVIIVLILGGLGYFIMGQKKPQPTMAIKTTIKKVLPTSTPTLTPTPTVPPVTEANAQQTLTNTDGSIQQSLDQVNTDMNSLNTVNSSQDNPNSL